MELRRIFPVLVLLLLFTSLLPLASSREILQSQAKGCSCRPWLSCSKKSWNEVKGMTAQAARDYIEAATPQCDREFVTIKSGSYFPAVYFADRVQIIVDNNGIALGAWVG
ncbi:unnamed protein product [Closterium sp. Yama58-4]|nr:unnamed protein product [Closterium sp. Yama58-4]